VGILTVVAVANDKELKKSAKVKFLGASVALTQRLPSQQP
jgi:hypothetical protein